MDTMLKYGIWQDWDAAQRAFATEESKKKVSIPLGADEKVLLKIFASQWYSKGIYHNWRPGHLYVTDRRIFLYRKEPAEMLFECSYCDIKGMTVEKKNNIAGKETGYLYLWLANDEIVQLHPSDAYLVRDAAEAQMKTLGLPVGHIGEMKLPQGAFDDNARQFLFAGEEVIHSGKMSYLAGEPRPGRTTTTVWKPGHLYLTSTRLVWWYDFDGRIALEIPREKLCKAQLLKKDLGGMLKDKPVLDLSYYNESEAEVVASMSDAAEELDRWITILQGIVQDGRTSNQALRGEEDEKSKEDEEDMEECPQCGKKDFVEVLLTKGCSSCGWKSPRLKKQEVVA
jgi:ribosomal protein L37E